MWLSCGSRLQRQVAISNRSCVMQIHGDSPKGQRTGLTLLHNLVLTLGASPFGKQHSCVFIVDLCFLF